MSLARLVITAVSVEGRTKSAVARDYGITRFGYRPWSNGSRPRVRPPTFRGRDGRIPRRTRSVYLGKAGVQSVPAVSMI